MTIAITAVPAGFKFNEVAGNNGAIANSLTLKITGGTFAGDNGDLVDATIDNVPNGLTAVLIKTSATTAKLILTGTADAHADTNDIANLTVTFADENFATGGAAPAAIENLAVNFNDPAEAGTLTLVPPAGADTTGVYSAGSKTNTFENLPTISGTGKAGEKIYIYSNGGTKPLDATKAVTVDENGKWALDLSDLKGKFKDGAHVVTASTSSDGKGAMSAPFAFTVDSKAPSAPSVTAIKGAISDVTPVLTGKAEKFATVKVYSSDTQVDPTLDEFGNVTNSDKVTLLGVTKADAKGVWTLQVEDPALLGAADTTYKISALAIDAAGNSTKSKKTVDLTIDTKIDTPTLVATAPKKNTVALSGKLEGETGGTVQLYGGADGSVPLGKVAKINKNGEWKMTLKLSEGEHLLSVVATDAAGNVSANSVIDDKTTVTIDTFTATPTVELVKAGDVLTGLKGTAEAGAEVTIKLGSKVLATKAVANDEGNWVLETVELPTVTKDTLVKITATAKDTANNVSKASTAVEYTVKPPVKDDTAPKFVSAETSTDGKTVILTYDEDLGGTAPDKGDFAVKSGAEDSEVTNPVTGVAISGKTVTLTLTNTVTAGQSVLVGYTAPTADNKVNTNAAIQDTAGNDAATLAATTVVENKVGAAADITPPEFDSAATNATGTQIILTYNEALHATTAAETAFDIVINGAPAINPSAVTVSGSTVVLTLATPITAGQSVKVGYTAPTVAAGTANAAIQDAAGNDAAELPATDVTNEVKAVTEVDSVAVTSATELTVTMTGMDAVDAKVMNSGSVVIDPVEFSGADTAVLTMTAQDTLVTEGMLVVTLADDSTTSSGAKVTLGTISADTITVPDWGYVFTFDGADILKFVSADNTVVIADYTVADDSIQLSKAVFTALGAEGALTANEFESGDDLTAAATVEGRIVYDTTTGDLYYDADGSDVAVAPVLVGTFTGKPALVVGEFEIVA